MKVIKPTTITPAKLTSSTVAEDEYDAWDDEIDYSVGANVIYSNNIYESVQTPNVNQTPSDTPLYWSLIGPTNRWAMFDSEVSTSTTAADEITVVISPVYVTGLAMFGLVGSSVSVTVQDGEGGPEVYEHEQSLDGSIVLDWYQYFFDPIEQLEEVVLTDLVPYANAHITVSITGTSVACGILALGLVHTLGTTEMGASASIIDYSRKDTDANGITTFTRRKFSKRMSARFLTENTQLNKLQQVLASLRATPCAWIGSEEENYHPLTVYGFYRDFSIDIAHPSQSYCSIEVEGLT